MTALKIVAGISPVVLAIAGLGLLLAGNVPLGVSIAALALLNGALVAFVLRSGSTS